MKAPAEKRCVLVPPVSECVVCGGTDFIDAQNGRYNQRDVYSCRGMLDGELCGLQCSRDDCGAVHYMSFASGGKKLWSSRGALSGQVSSLMRSTESTLMVLTLT